MSGFARLLAVLVIAVGLGTAAVLVALPETLPGAALRSACADADARMAGLTVVAPRSRSAVICTA